MAPAQPDSPGSEHHQQQEQQLPSHSYTVGYAFLPGKSDTFVQPSFLDHAARRGVRFVAVDASRPLAEQGPFDLVVHKLYDPRWRAQLEAFAAANPGVPVVDPPAAVERVLDRFTMLDVVSGLDVAAKEGVVAVPRQAIIRDADALAAAADADDDGDLFGGLRFPLIAKPVEVDGSAASHDLCLVYRREGLRSLHTPLVLQEFVNHGGVLFKVYVVGDHATCVMRSSLPDVADERLRDLDAAAAVPFANISLRPPTTTVAGDGEDNVKMPPAEFIDKVARQLRRALGLHLINFDLIRAKDGKYLILDINYCPGYSKMPGFEPVLTEFFLEMIRSGPVRGQPGPDSSPDCEARETQIEPTSGPAEAKLGRVGA
ncbi:hypothetical protein ACP4OV_031124 [Aristida adscensionis]